jgi:hypothetical protein
VRKLKDGLQVALDKSQTDDQLLEALKAEVNRLSQRRRPTQTPTSNENTQARSNQVNIEEVQRREEQYETEIRRLQRLLRNQVSYSLYMHILNAIHLLFMLNFRASSWMHKTLPYENYERNLLVLIITHYIELK